MLLSLTSFYEDADPSNHPRLCVLFNNVSKISHAKKALPQYGASEANKDEKATPAVGEQANNTWSEYITSYRGMLVEALEQKYVELEDTKFLKARVEKLFPDENFYFYQMR